MRVWLGLSGNGDEAGLALRVSDYSAWKKLFHNAHTKALTHRINGPECVIPATLGPQNLKKYSIKWRRNLRCSFSLPLITINLRQTSQPSTIQDAALDLPQQPSPIPGGYKPNTRKKRLEAIPRCTEYSPALMRRVDGRCGRSRPNDLQKDFTPLEFSGTCEKFRCIYDAVAVNTTVNISSDFQATAMSCYQSTASAIAHSFSARTLWRLRFIPREQWLSLVELLRETKTFQATDPRDRIFAPVGLASDLHPEFVRSFVDYGKSLADIQTELAIWLLRHQIGVGSFLFSHVKSTGHSDFLPSRVPDWTG